MFITFKINYISEWKIEIAKRKQIKATADFLLQRSENNNNNLNAALINIFLSVDQMTLCTGKGCRS